jgi:hypothetical protein
LAGGVAFYVDLFVRPMAFMVEEAGAHPTACRDAGGLRRHLTTQGKGIAFPSSAVIAARALFSMLGGMKVAGVCVNCRSDTGKLLRYPDAVPVR